MFGGLNSLRKQKDVKPFLHQHVIGLFGLLRPRLNLGLLIKLVSLFVMIGLSLPIIFGTMKGVYGLFGNHLSSL